MRLCWCPWPEVCVVLAVLWAGALQGFALWCCSEGLVWKTGFMDFGTLLRATNGGITLTHVGAKLPDFCDGKKPCRQEGGADNAWEALQVDSGPCRSLVWDPGGFNSCSLKAGKTILTSSGLKPGSLCPVAPRGNLQNAARNLHLASKCFSSSLGLTLGTFPRLLEQDNAPTALACPTEPSFVPAPQAPHAGCRL